MLALATVAPAFDLPDVMDGKNKSLDSIKSDKATLIMFICNHCPYVKHVNEEIARLGADYGPKGISLVAISANDADNYPDDSPGELKAQAVQFGFNFLVIYNI